MSKENEIYNRKEVETDDLDYYDDEYNEEEIAEQKTEDDIEKIEETMIEWKMDIDKYVTENGLCLCENLNYKILEEMIKIMENF